MNNIIELSYYEDNDCTNRKRKIALNLEKIVCIKEVDINFAEVVIDSNTSYLLDRKYEDVMALVKGQLLGLSEIKNF